MNYFPYNHPPLYRYRNKKEIIYFIFFNITIGFFLESY